MNDTDLAILSERVQQNKVFFESMDTRLKQMELLHVSMDKSLAIYEVGLQGTKDWVKQLENEIIEIEDNKVTSNRYWLSVFFSAGALVIAIITLIYKVVGG